MGSLSVLKYLGLSEGILFFLGGVLASAYFLSKATTLPHQILCVGSLICAFVILSELISALIYYHPSAEVI